MAVSHGYSKITTSGSVFAYDTGDTFNSYKGEPTTNMVGLFPSATTLPALMAFTYEYQTTIVDPPVYGTPFDNQKWVKFVKTSPSNGRAVFLTTPVVSGSVYNWSMYVYTDDSRNTQLSIGSDNGAVSATLSNTPYNFTRLGTVQRINNVFRSLTGGVVQGLRGGASDPTGSTWYATGFQCELNDHATQPVTGSRSISGSLFDVSGYGKVVNSLSASYNSSAQLFFSGSNFLTVDPLSRLLTHTVEAIFRPTAHPNNNGCVVSDTYSTFVNYKLGYTGIGTMSGGFYSGSWRETPSITTDLNLWQHVVYTYDGATLSIYKNASLGGTTSFVGFPNTNGINFRIGRRWDLADYFAGDISVIRIYDRALSPSEILDNYNHYKTRFNLP